MDTIISKDATSTSKMTTAGSSQIIVSIYWTTQHHTSENHNFNTNLNSIPNNYTTIDILYDTWWVHLQGISDGTSNQHHLSITLVTSTAIYILKCLCGNVAEVVKHGKVHSMKQLQKKLWTHRYTWQQAWYKARFTRPIWWALVMAWFVETLCHQSVGTITIIKKAC